MTLLKKKPQKINSASKFLTPSQTRVFNMDHATLLRHYVLIVLKISKTLSTSQREIVVNRVKYLVEKKVITSEQLENTIDEINMLMKDN